MSSVDIPWVQGTQSCGATITPCPFLETTRTLIFTEHMGAWPSEGFLHQTPPHRN